MFRERNGFREDTMRNQVEEEKDGEGALTSAIRNGDWDRVLSIAENSPDVASRAAAHYAQHCMEVSVVKYIKINFFVCIFLFCFPFLSFMHKRDLQREFKREVFFFFFFFALLCFAAFCERKY